MFVWAEDGGEQVLRDRAPIAGSSSDYLREQFVDAALIEARDFEAIIERFFRYDDVAFLHVWYHAYGYFSCRIDRS